MTLEIERAGTSAAGAGTALGSAAAMSAAGRRRADESTTLEAAWRGRSKESGGKKGRQRLTAGVAKNRPVLDARGFGLAEPPPSPAFSATTESDDQSRKKSRDKRAEACLGVSTDTMGAGGVADDGQGGKGDNEGEEREGLEGQEKVASPRRRKDAVLTLFDDALHRIMLFLHPEDISECRAVSSQWTFPQHEAVFEGLCRRTYPGQVHL